MLIYGLMIIWCSNQFQGEGEFNQLSRDERRTKRCAADNARVISPSRQSSLRLSADKQNVGFEHNEKEKMCYETLFYKAHRVTNDLTCHDNNL